MSYVDVWFNREEHLFGHFPLQRGADAGFGLSTARLFAPGCMGGINGYEARLARVGGVVENGKTHASGLYVWLKPYPVAKGLTLVTDGCKPGFDHDGTIPPPSSLDEFVAVGKDMLEKLLALKSSVRSKPILFYATSADMEQVKRDRNRIFA